MIPKNSFCVRFDNYIFSGQSFQRGIKSDIDHLFYGKRILSPSSPRCCIIAAERPSNPWLIYVLFITSN